MSEPIGVPRWVREIEPGRALRHAEASFGGTRGMNARDFADTVRNAYDTVFSQLDEEGHHPVRFWNFLPGIHDVMEEDRSRYMLFNAARHASFETRFARAADFSQAIPTASAVGVDDDLFSLHCLGAAEAGVSVENPRQIPAYLYSQEYGPKPPCFARATALAVSFPAPTLLVAGTSSITGERSRHEGDLPHQFLETIRNLAHLVAHAGGRLLPEGQPLTTINALLRAFRDIRVYYVNRADEPLIRQLVGVHFPHAARVEYARVSLCRPELLVEIEGLAEPSTAQ